MKRCPVCSAMAFEDMDTCFSCLHHFEDEPSVETMKANLNGDNEPPYRKDAYGTHGSASKADGVPERAQPSTPSPATRLSAEVGLPSYRLEIMLVPVTAKDAALA